MIETIEDPEFKKVTSIGHAFFTRKGGVSTGYYASLNCTHYGFDDHNNVLENRRRAMAYINFPLESFKTVRNVHGDNIIEISDPLKNYQQCEADGMVTKLKNIVLASDSADCPIVLFADAKAGIIGLAHAGWKGAKGHVIENTVDKMTSLGANQNNIHAVVGPCITQDSYEVDTKFYKKFLALDEKNTSYFKNSQNSKHFLFDLLGYVKSKLTKLSLKSVTAIGLDTYSNEDLFFSYRRTWHRKKSEFGGNLACVYFKGR